MKQPSKILLAEDNKFVSRAYEESLKQAGFEVEVAFDGKEALEKIKANKPDLLLLDIVMPEKNGFEVLEKLKKEEETKKIPVIILSNLGQEVDLTRGKALGAVDYFVKTEYSMKDVIKRIKFHLNEEEEE